MQFYVIISTSLCDTYQKCLYHFIFLFLSLMRLRTIDGVSVSPQINASDSIQFGIDNTYTVFLFE